LKINGPKLACDAKSSTVSPTSGCLSSNGISQQGRFTLSLYDEFLIADVDGSRSGEFNGLGEGGLVGNYGGTDLFITYQAGDGNDMGLFAQGLPGDFDFNGEVNGLDFLLWQRDPSVGSLADWQSNYGMVATLSASSAAVPEPTTLLLGALASIGLMIRRRCLPSQSHIG